MIEQEILLGVCHIHHFYFPLSKCHLLQVGYFPKDRSGTSVLVNKMSKGTQMVFLMLDAISHTCLYFGNMGVNPKEPRFTQTIRDWIEENNLPEYMELAGDALLMHTFFSVFKLIAF